jgi:CRISPR/Cas system-associated exonuclease Cas4 (RecB family)
MIAGNSLPVIERTGGPTPSANPANEIARKLTGRDYISWSALSTFRTCPLRFYYRYVAGLPEESVSSALVFGGGVHAAVEQHFQSILSGGPKPDLDSLLFAYRSAWLPHDPEKVSFGASETRESLDALAAKMLSAFLANPAAAVQGRVLGVEEEIRGTLVPGMPDLYGRVDLLTEDDDQLVISDVKTSRSRWSADQAEESAEQLLLYSRLASELAPGKKLVTRFLVITKTKEPVIEEHVAEVKPERVTRTLAGAQRVWQAIQTGVFYPAPSPMACAGCPFREACSKWQG